MQMLGMHACFLLSHIFSMHPLLYSVYFGIIVYLDPCYLGNNQTTSGPHYQIILHYRYSICYSNNLNLLKVHHIRIQV